MRDVNDDMDELFRRAADSYPLNTNSADWKKVQSALESSIDSPQKDIKRNKGYRLLWLLLLLPFTFALNKYIVQNNHRQNAPQLLKSAKQDQVALEQEKNLQEKPGKRSVNKEDVPNERSLNENNISLSTNVTIDNKSTKSITFVRQKTVRQKFIRASTHIAIGNADLDILTDVNDKVNEDKEINKDNDFFNNSQNTTESKVEKINIEAKSETKEISKVTETPGKTTVAATDSLKNNDIKKTKKQNVSNKQTLHHLYAGIIIGPDISTVKLQKVNKTGFTAGIIAGYRLSKKISIESGLLLDKKYYYTEGKYFSTEKINIPYYTEIDNVDGYCSMMELPLNVKYDFKLSKKVKWFGIVGASSYFMRKENYSYRYRHYGQQMEKDLSLKESTKIWASVLNLGLGYSHKIGKTGNLRLEPYIKIPFKTVGIGSLPITSSGVYIGFTKNLF